MITLASLYYLFIPIYYIVVDLDSVREGKDMIEFTSSVVTFQARGRNSLSLSLSLQGWWGGGLQGWIRSMNLSVVNNIIGPLI